MRHHKQANSDVIAHPLSQRPGQSRQTLRHDDAVGEGAAAGNFNTKIVEPHRSAAHPIKPVGPRAARSNAETPTTPKGHGNCRPNNRAATASLHA